MPYVHCPAKVFSFTNLVKVVSRSSWCALTGHQMSLYVEHMACCLLLVPCALLSIVCPLPSRYPIIVSVAPPVSPSFVSLFSLLVYVVLCWSVVFCCVRVMLTVQTVLSLPPCLPVFCLPAHRDGFRARSVPWALTVHSRARSVPWALRVCSRARSVPWALRVHSRARSISREPSESAAEPAPFREPTESAPGARSVPWAHRVRSGSPLC